MNHARIAIGLVALLIAVSAGAVVLSDADQSDAASSWVIGDIEYNSEIGFEFDVSLESGSVSIRVDSGASNFIGSVSDGHVIAEQTTGTAPVAGEISIQLICPGAVPPTAAAETMTLREITFDMGDAPVVDPVIVSDGYVYTLPECDEPSFSYWTVNGQNLNPGATVEINANTVITAVYGEEPLPVEPETVMIAGVPETVAVGDSFKLTATVGPEGAPQDVEWSTSDSSVAKVDNDGTVIINGPGSVIITATASGTSVSGTVDLTVPEPVVTEYTVTFDSNGGSAVEPQTVEAGQSIETAPVTTREGYTFDGWFTEAQGGERIAFPYQVNGSVTFYAHWTQVEPEEYTVTFDSNGGSDVESITVQAGQSIESEPVTTRDGYTFDGWYTQQTGGDRVSFPYQVNGSVTLYAHWTSVPVTEEYTVTFDSNGGSAVESRTVEAGQSIGTAPVTTRDGYAFDGWFTESGIEVEFPYTPRGDVTLYAHWIAIHTVTFYSDGSVYMSVQVADGEQVSEPETDPSKDGYTFAGWFADEACTQSYDFQTPVTGDLNLYAKFIPVEQPVYCEVTITKNEHITGLTVTDSDGKTIENGDSVLSGTRLTVEIEVEDGYQVYEGDSYTVRVTGDITIAPDAVAEIDVTVVPGEHGSASLGSLVLASDDTWTATIVLDPVQGYRANVSFAPEGNYDHEIDRNGDVVVRGLTADLTVNVSFEQIPVTDDDDEYVPPVITVIPDDGDDSTTYIVAIAAGVVVAILAALILMQTRKS